MFGLLGAFVELRVVVRAGTYGAHNRTAAAALFDRETGPDLTCQWQWTLAVVVCAALAGVCKKRKREIEFN
jgi:hypothetical protein